MLAEQRIDLDTGDYLSLWPHKHGTDGFFAAVLERVPEPRRRKRAERLKTLDVKRARRRRHAGPLLSHMLGGLVRDFGEPVVIWQAARAARPAWRSRGGSRASCDAQLDARRQSRFEALRFGAESLNKALFPLLGTVFVSIAQIVMSRFMHTVAACSSRSCRCLGITVIYTMFYVARRVFSRGGEAHALLFLFEKVVTTSSGSRWSLTVMGIQDDVVHWMESVRFRVANAHMTLLSLATGVLWVCVTLIVATLGGRGRSKIA